MATVEQMADPSEDSKNNGIEMYPYSVDIRPMLEEPNEVTEARIRLQSQGESANISQTESHDLDLKVGEVDNHADHE